MTCIVGFVDKKNGITYIGGDSLGSNGYSGVIRKDKKVFKLKDSDKGIIGYTSSFRMGQILMYSDGLLDKRDEITHEYMVTRVIPNIINKLECGGYSRNRSGEKEGGTFLFGYKDKLFKIESDYQVGESINNYDACGSGEYFALGSLKTTEDMDLAPIEKIHKALQVASQFSVGVAPPFYIINTKDDEVIEFKD